MRESSGGRSGRCSEGEAIKLLGKLIGTLLILCGFVSGLTIFTGSFYGRYPMMLPVLWAGFLLLGAVGVIVHSLSARFRDSGVAVKRTSIGLVVLGVSAFGVLWLNARDIVHVREPVQLWLLFATSMISGVFGIFTSRF